MTSRYLKGQVMSTTPLGTNISKTVEMLFSNNRKCQTTSNTGQRALLASLYRSVRIHS